MGEIKNLSDEKIKSNYDVYYLKKDKENKKSLSFEAYKKKYFRFRCGCRDKDDKINKEKNKIKAPDIDERKIGNYMQYCSKKHKIKEKPLSFETYMKKYSRFKNTTAHYCLVFVKKDVWKEFNNFALEYYKKVRGTTSYLISNLFLVADINEILKNSVEIAKSKHRKNQKNKEEYQNIHMFVDNEIFNRYKKKLNKRWGKITEYLMEKFLRDEDYKKRVLSFPI